MATSFAAFLSSKPRTKELTEHVNVGTKWNTLGTMLDLDQKQLQDINGKAISSTQKMIEMFNLWRATTPTASRRQVLEALRKSVMGENALAYEYENYLKDLYETTYAPPSTKAVSILERNIQSLNEGEALVSPVQVSQLLYSKRCISEATLNEMERIDQRRSLDDKKTTLLAAMQETVSSDYRKLKDIATVLSDVEVANNIMTEYEEKIPQDDDSTVVQPQAVVGSDEDRASDILRNNYSALSQSITEPVRMAKWLHGEVISDEALSCVMSTRGSVSDSRAVLLKAVRDAVHSNYKHLELFVTVLRKFSETAHIGDTIFEEYKHNFNTGLEDVEEMETEGGNSQYASSESGCSVIAEDSANQRVKLRRNMRKEFQQMRAKFGTTFYNVQVIFSKKAKSKKFVDEMKTLLAYINPDLKPELSHKKTIKDVLDVVYRNCSIVDVHPLEVLAVRFKIKEAEDIIKEYKEAAKEFCKSVSVSLSENETFQAISTRYLLHETITFVLNWNADKTTLQDVNDVLSELDLLHKYHVKVIKVGPNRSVVVTCYCPAEYTGSLIMDILGNIEILQEKGLKEFKVGNCTIWNNTAHEVLSAMTTKEIEQPTKKTVNNYEDMERDLLSMKQQLAEKEKQVQELEMKLQTKQEKEHIHILPTESVDELNKKLETECAISRRKTMEIEDLKATMKQKDEKIINTENDLASLKELSETRLQEIEQLKLKLEDNIPVEKTSETIKDESSDDDTSSNEDIVMKPDDKSLTIYLQKDGVVEWSQYSVRLTSPSVDQCKEVISKLKEEHKSIILNRSSSDSTQVLIPTVLERGTINQLNIFYSFLTRADILSFSSKLSTNKSLTTLALTTGSISDDGVITLAQSLLHNKQLKNLHLNDNPGITSDSAHSLAELLLTNKRLQYLRLHRTSINTDGVLILMESLMTNNTLKQLWLDKEHEETCLILPYYEHIKNRQYFSQF